MTTLENKMASQTEVFIALKYPVKMLFFAAAALSQVLLVSADKTPTPSSPDIFFMSS